MNITGKWYIDKALAVVEKAKAEGAVKAAQVLLEASQQQVPLDTGALMESGRVEYDGESASVSYSAPYALRWHEEHANFQNGRKNKYLEDPANDGTVQARMIECIKSELNF